MFLVFWRAFLFVGGMALGAVLVTACTSLSPSLPSGTSASASPHAVRAAARLALQLSVRVATRQLVLRSPRAAQTAASIHALAIDGVRILHQLREPTIPGLTPLLQTARERIAGDPLLLPGDKVLASQLLDLIALETQRQLAADSLASTEDVRASVSEMLQWVADTSALYLALPSAQAVQP